MKQAIFPIYGCGPEKFCFIDIPGLLDGKMSFDAWSSKFMDGLKGKNISLVLLIVSSLDRCDGATAFIGASVKAFLS